MKPATNQQGISALSIILLGMLALSVVLLDAISINLQQRSALAEQHTSVADQYCFRSHEKYPPECNVTSVQHCGQYFMLTSNCLGTGVVIVNSQGEYLDWCGYTTLEGVPTSCGQLTIDSQGKNCANAKNLCGT